MAAVGVGGKSSSLIWGDEDDEDEDGDDKLANFIGTFRSINAERKCGADFRNASLMSI